MMYEICSLMKSGQRLVALDDTSARIVDANYIEGAIVWRIGNSQLMSETHWDCVDQLWAYMINGAIQLLECGTFETYFPDQPLLLRFVRKNDNQVEVIIGDQKYTVDCHLFIASLTDGGRDFFTTMCKRVPNRRDLWKLYLRRISELLSRSTDT